MRLIVEARFEGSVDGAAEAERTVVAVLNRKDASLGDFGCSLAEGRALLAAVQSVLITRQSEVWLAEHAVCRLCGRALAHKDSGSIVMRTVFGKVALPSPRYWICRCTAAPGQPRRSESPLAKALPSREG